MKRYKVNEVFWSPQGEGMRAGEMSAFVRLCGCNMKCRMEEADDSPGGFDCDTEFESGRMRTAEEVCDDVAEAMEGAEPDKDYAPWIVFSGGEPALQLDCDLVGTCQRKGYRCAIETNGSIDVSMLGLDWITVSPKVAEHAIRQMQADEVKYVRGWGQAIPKTRVVADHYLISPAFNGLTQDRKAIEWCCGLVRKHPRWRLSIQLHKSWGVR